MDETTLLLTHPLAYSWNKELEATQLKKTLCVSPEQLPEGLVRKPTKALINTLSDKVLNQYGSYQKLGLQTDEKRQDYCLQLERVRETGFDFKGLEALEDTLQEVGQGEQQIREAAITIDDGITRITTLRKDLGLSTPPILLYRAQQAEQFLENYQQMITTISNGIREKRPDFYLR